MYIFILTILQILPAVKSLSVLLNVVKVCLLAGSFTLSFNTSMSLLHDSSKIKLKFDLSGYKLKKSIST